MPSRKEIWLPESEMSVRITEGQEVQIWQDMKMKLRPIQRPSGFKSEEEKDAVAPPEA